jgi:DNA recombination protein RmuC
MQPFFAAFAALAGILLGYFLRHASAKNEKKSLELNAAQNAALALDAERRSAEARESGLREQIETARSEVAELRPKAEELAASRQKLVDEQAKYIQMKAELDSAFKSAAADALRANTQSFLALAKQELGGQAQDARHTLETKEKAIQALLQPLEVTLKSLDLQTRAMEKERAGAYGEIRTLVEGFNKEIPESLKNLRTETSQLITALRAPKTRGNWGELQLKRCVEYAGMVQYCSFSEQVSARDEDEALLRPDMKIQLPNGRCIIVDAKTPLDAFLGSSDSGDGYAQALRFAAHAETVKSHLKKLSAKTYWKQFDHTPEFVVCFLPSEALFSAALEADPSLIEFSAHANVVMATPTTLIALLKAIAYGWQQSTITQNAKAIQQTGADLYNKLVKAHEHFEKLGNALKGAVAHYNSFIGAVEGRQGAFYQARKLGALVHSSSELDVAEQLESEPRLLTSEHWTPQIQLPMANETEEPVASE